MELSTARREDTEVAVEARVDDLLRQAARTWKDRGAPARLLELSLELLRLDPGLGPPFVYLGWCYEQQEQPGLAFEMYQRALHSSLRGDRRDFAEARVRYLASRVRRERREVEIENAIAAARTSHDATTLAIALREDGRPNAALKAHGRAVELAGSADEATRALTSWAATCRDLGDFEEALRLADRALELDACPRTNGPAHAVRIAALCDLGDATNATIWGELALKTVPDDPYILRAMGRAYRELIRVAGFKPSIADQAERCFVDALRFGGGRAAVVELDLLLDLYRREGRLDRVARLEAVTARGVART